MYQACDHSLLFPLCPPKSKLPSFLASHGCSGLTWPLHFSSCHPLFVTTGQAEWSLPCSQASKGFPMALRMESECPPHLREPLVSHLFPSLSPVFQSHWVAFCSGNMSGLSFSSFYICCSLSRIFLPQIWACLDHSCPICAQISPPRPFLTFSKTFLFPVTHCLYYSVFTVFIAHHLKLFV